MSDQNPSRSLAAAWWSARPALLLLAGGELLLAGLTAVPFATALERSLGRRPALAELADGDWLTVLMEIGVASAGGSSALASAAAPTALLGVLSLVLHALLYNFVAGAALSMMAGRAESPLPAGSSWFWPMLRMGVLVVLAAVVFGGIAAVALLLLPVQGLLPALAKIPAWLIWMGAIGSLFELARAQMVSAADRSALRGLRRALLRLVRRPVAVIGVWLALGVAGLLTYGLVLVLTLAASAGLPWQAWPVTLLTIVLGAGYKLLRLAAQLRLAV